MVILFTASLYVFLVCPAEMLPSTAEDWETSLCFQVWSVSIGGLSGSGVHILHKDRTGSFSRQDSNCIRQDGNFNRQAEEIQDRVVSRWMKPQSLYRVM